MLVEIEKKYLLTQDAVNLIIQVVESDLIKGKSLIKQSYLSLTPEIRIRKKNNKYFLTKKGDGTQIREEIETEISEKTYSILENLVIGNVIDKIRINITLQDGLTAEVDIYQGALSGLYTVEVEFKSEKQALNFTAPYWFGKEITDDKRYKNKSLSQLEDPSKLIEESYPKQKTLKP